MGDWQDELTPEEREQFDALVKHFRETALQPLMESGFAMSLIGDGENFDVKGAMELGAMIMLDKPLLVVASPGAKIPVRLQRAADQVVLADVDTEEGRASIAGAIKVMQARIPA